MDNQGTYNNFVFCGNWRQALETLRKEKGDEYAKALLWELVNMGTSKEDFPIEYDDYVYNIMLTLAKAQMVKPNSKQVNNGGKVL